MMQGELNFGMNEAKQWRAKELIFAQGLINLMEKLARKDAQYIKMLHKFAADNHADLELVQMVRDALERKHNGLI